MKRTLPFLIAMVMAILGWVVVAPTAAGTVPAQPCVTYTYDAPAHDTPDAGAVSERDPPATRDRGTTYDTVDLGSRGTIACPESLAASSTTYAYLAGPAQAAPATPTIGRHVALVDGDHPSLELSVGAAKTGGEGVDLLRHVSPGELSDIQKSGVFRSGSGSMEGKWFAESGEHAQQWGNVLNGGQGAVVTTRVPSSVADKMMRMDKLDGIGPARYADNLAELNANMNGIRLWP